MSPVSIFVRMMTGALMIAPLICCGTVVFAGEPDAKSIPKPILMLGLYCNSSLSAMKSPFETNPGALPWLATGPKVETIKFLISKLDVTNAPYEKAIRDQAITEEEAKFIKFSAHHETGQWLININQSCATQNLASQAYEACLKEINSEVYKCYRVIIDGMQAMGKSTSNK